MANEEYHNYIQLGMKYEEEGKPAEAITAYGKARSLVPQDLGRDLPYAFFRRGLVYYNIKQHDNAIKDLTSAIGCQGFPLCNNLVKSLAYHYRGMAYFFFKEDIDRAVPDFGMAAELGHADSQVYYGNAYSEGLSVQQDKVKAGYWLGKAAEQGNAQGMTGLGKLYRDGHGGFKQDFTRAEELFNKAIAAGDDDAKEELAKLREMRSGPSVKKTSSTSPRRKSKNPLFSIVDYDSHEGSWIILGIVGAVIGFLIGSLIGWNFSGIIGAVLGAIISTQTIGKKVHINVGKLILIFVIGVALICGVLFALSKVPAKPKPAAKTTEATQTKTVTVNANVNFRAGPSTDNTIIRQLPQGETITLTGMVSGGWTQIQHNGDTGWISSEFVKEK